MRSRRYLLWIFAVAAALHGCAAVASPEPGAEDPCLRQEQSEGSYSLEELARRYECQKSRQGGTQ